MSQLLFISVVGGEVSGGLDLIISFRFSKRWTSFMDVHDSVSQGATFDIDEAAFLHLQQNIFSQHLFTDLSTPESPSPA